MGDTRNRSLQPYAGFLVLLMWLASACGPAETNQIEVTVTQPTGLVVVADDYLFLPASVTLPAESIISLRNVGRLDHSWTVLTDSVEDELDIRAVSALIDARVRPGETVSLDVGGLLPGVYPIVCVIPGHFSAGMIGELTITGE